MFGEDASPTLFTTLRQRQLRQNAAPALGASVQPRPCPWLRPWPRSCPLCNEGYEVKPIG